jgi:predicted pyridoxine 5'-phosphate oxidase superfamily flavin-nucleotide-binding protein
MAVLGERAIRKHMPEQHRQFFSQLPFVLVGSIDQEGQPWASVLTGAPGFPHSPNRATLRVHASCTPGDPLCTNLRLGAEVGVLGLQPHTRRRNRANGVVAEIGTRGFALAVAQSFGNYLKYIQAREGRYTGPGPAARFEALHGLGEGTARLIRSADTFFIATAHPDAVCGGIRAHGVDISHRGGLPGFVRLDALGHLTVPDFVGNFFFNTLGNLAVHPFAGLLFINYVSGDLLSLAASASVIWDGPEVAAFAGATARAFHAHGDTLRPRGAAATVGSDGAVTAPHWHRDLVRTAIRPITHWSNHANCTMVGPGGANLGIEADH